MRKRSAVATTRDGAFSRRNWPPSRRSWNRRRQHWPSRDRYAWATSATIRRCSIACNPTRTPSSATRRISRRCRRKSPTSDRRVRPPVQGAVGMSAASYAGLDLLATAVIVLRSDLRFCYANAAAEQLLQTSRRTLLDTSFEELFIDAMPFADKLRQALSRQWGFWDQGLMLTRPGQESLLLNVVATPVDQPAYGLLLELRSIDQHRRIEREEQLLHQHQANRELIRNLAHEIKNPLGGLRGSAQLLEPELDREELREYTQVIIKEADRLQ